MARVSDHIIMLGPDGDTLVDTDPRQRDRRKITHLYVVYGSAAATVAPTVEPTGDQAPTVEQIEIIRQIAREARMTALVKVAYTEVEKLQSLARGALRLDTTTDLHIDADIMELARMTAFADVSDDLLDRAASAGVVEMLRA